MPPKRLGETSEERSSKKNLEPRARGSFFKTKSFTHTQEYVQQKFLSNPGDLAAKMLQGLDVKGKYILEPSAGKGDLASYFSYQARVVHVIEIEPDLRAILRQKRNCKVVAEDFLTYRPAARYDYIIMNPPFDRGAEHLLHAWEIADGAEIVCLLNAETIRNPHTQEREILAEIIKQFGGTVEFVKDAFKNAERRTNVEVAIVRLKKPASSKSTFGFEALQAYSGNGNELDKETVRRHTDIANKNFIQNSVKSFDNMLEGLKQVFDGFAKLRYFAAGCGVGLSGSIYNQRDWEAELYQLICAGNKNAYNQACELLSRKAWEDIFLHKEYRKLLTSAVKKGFEAEQQERGTTAYTESNLNGFLEIILQGRGAAMQMAIDNSFDELCRYSPKNKLVEETWKTNSHYKVGKKVILPALHEFDGRFNFWNPQFSASTTLEDLDKALCFVTGKNYDKISSIIWSIQTNKDWQSGAEIDSEFFMIKVYKKGTMHLTFKDDTVWALFNQAAARGKNWIG